MTHDVHSPVSVHRGSRSRSLCAALLSVTLASGAVVACDNGADPTADDERRERFAAMSGEEIFVGLFLGQGEAASLLPEVHDRTELAEQLRDPTEILDALSRAKAEREAQGDSRGAALVQSAIEAIESGAAAEQLADGIAISETLASMFVQEIAAKDPTFFTRFGDEIRSGDPRRVDRALQEAAAIGREVAEATLFAADPLQPRAGAILFLVVAVHAAVAVFVLAWAGAFVWVEIAVESAIEERSRGGRLFRDEFVARVTEAYAPQ